MRTNMLVSILVVTAILVCDGSDPCPPDASISVVYNCFIWPDQAWASLITYQLKHIMRTGIADCATIHVVMSIPAFHSKLTYDELELLLDEGQQLVHSILPVRRSTNDRGAILSQVHENSYDYPGLHLLWLLAQVRTQRLQSFASRQQYYNMSLCMCTGRRRGAS